MTTINNMEEEKNFGFHGVPFQEVKEHVFKRIEEKMFETYKAKNGDYGDAFAKLYKMKGMDYPIIHFFEKVFRIDALCDKEKRMQAAGISGSPNNVNGEDYKDSLLDLANYAILTLIELELDLGSDNKK